MPMPLAMLAGLGVLLIYFFVGIRRLIVLSLFAVPLAFAIKNIISNRGRSGQWLMKWSRFVEVILLAGLILVYYALVLISEVPIQSAAIVLAAMIIFFLVCAIGISLYKEDTGVKNEDKKTPLK